MRLNSIVFEKFQSLILSSNRRNGAANSKSVDGNKLNYLESVRGLAACAVVFAHLLAVYLPGVLQKNNENLADNAVAGMLFYGLPLGFMSSGHFAVVLFFVLSGFVLTYKFFETGNQKDLHRQAAKRFLRLAIPIFVIVMIAYGMVSNNMMGYTNRVVELTGSTQAANNYNFTPTLLDSFHAAIFGVLVDENVKLNPVLWTMPVEFFGSFIVFGLAAFVSVVRYRWVIYIGAIILLGDSYYVCFILGMMLSDIIQRTSFLNFIRKNISRVYYVLAMLVVVVISSFPLPSWGLDGTIYKSFLIPNVDTVYIFKLWQYFGGLLLLTLIVCSLYLQKILNNRVLVFLGGISFSVYLIHYLVLYSAGNYSYVLARNTYGVGVSALIAGCVTVIITLIVAIIWKKYIDDLSVRVSRSFANLILK